MNLRWLCSTRTSYVHVCSTATWSKLSWDHNPARSSPHSKTVARTMRIHTFTLTCTRTYAYTWTFSETPRVRSMGAIVPIRLRLMCCRWIELPRRSRPWVWHQLKLRDVARLCAAAARLVVGKPGPFAVFRAPRGLSCCAVLFRDPIVQVIRHDICCYLLL